MKKRLGIALIFGILLLISTVVACLLTGERNDTFWVSIGFWGFSVVVAFLVTERAASHKLSPLAAAVPLVILSVLYMAAVGVIGIVGSAWLALPLNVYLSIQLIALAIYAVLLVLIMLVRGYIQRNAD